jgi:hypothetical protein
MLVTNTGEHSIFYQRKQILRWEKESNTVKGARFFFIVESITSC